MRIIEGKLLSKKPEGDDAYAVVLKMPFNQVALYRVPKDAAYIHALGGSGSTLECDTSFNKNVGKPARLAIDGHDVVWAFRASTNIGFEDIKSVAKHRKRQARHAARAHTPIGRFANKVEDIASDVMRDVMWGLRN